MRRHAVARHLQVSIARVKALEAEGKLHPRKDDDGWHVSFDRAEVMAFAETYRPKQPTGRRRAAPRVERPAASGRVAGLLFAAFKANKDLRDIVTEYNVPPELVRRLYREWKTPLEEGERQRAAEHAAARERREQREHDRRMARADAQERRQAHERKLARDKQNHELDVARQSRRR